MQLPIAERGTKTYDVLMIKHQFDKDYLLMSFEEEEAPLEKRFKDLTMRSLEISSNMQGLDETNMYSFGKLRLKLIDLKNLPCSSTFFVRVSSGPFTLRSRKIISARHSHANYNISQVFFIPITNRFGHITVEIVSSTVKGLFKGNTVQQVLFSTTIPIPKLKE